MKHNFIPNFILKNSRTNRWKTFLSIFQINVFYKNQWKSSINRMIKMFPVCPKMLLITHYYDQYLTDILYKTIRIHCTVVQRVSLCTCRCRRWRQTIAMWTFKKKQKKGTNRRWYPLKRYFFFIIIIENWIHFT